MSNAIPLTVRVADLQGSHFQIGLAQGRDMRERNQTYRYEPLNPPAHLSNTEEAAAWLERLSPNLLQELNGLATGLDKDVGETIRLYSGYDVNVPAMGCTTVAGNGYYARNYDFSPDLYDGRLVFTRPEQGYAAIGFSHQVVGRLDGMNEEGLVVGLHFVNTGVRDTGFSPTVIVRMLLEQCATVAEATEMLGRIPHGYGYNYSLADRNGEVAAVEASPRRQITRTEQPLVCTNHFESEQLAGMNGKQTPFSLRRRKAAKSLFTARRTPQEAYRLLNDEASPLFVRQYSQWFGTLHTVVYCPNTLEAMIGIGGHFQPVTFSLRAYKEGGLALPRQLTGTIRPENPA